MSRVHRQLLYGWLGLLALVAIEFGASILPLPRGLRPALMLPALAMVAVVGVAFMRAKRGPSIVRVFAFAGLFWLTILLGLGMMDPLTRAVYTVQSAELP